MKLMLVGDIHGSKWALNRAMTNAFENDVERVFFLGDFGYSFDKDFLTLADACYTDMELYVDFIDGNHEDFDFLLNIPVSEDGYRYLSRGVRHIPRGTILDLDGASVLCMGGATSIDRAYRLAVEEATGTKHWWKQEAITEADVMRACDNMFKADLDVVDAMFTHDSPVLPEGSNKMDEYLDDVERTRSQVNRDKIAWLVRKYKPVKLYHGHHHTEHRVDYDTTSVVGLPHSDYHYGDYFTIVDTEDWTY